MQIANVMKIFCETAQQIKHRTTQNESKNLICSAGYIQYCYSLPKYHFNKVSIIYIYIYILYKIYIYIYIYIYMTNYE